MATIRAKMKQLRNADVRYISLVDRAATRIPFRVLKRDKENKMGIDLTKVFKSDNTEKPYVSALVVFAQKDETAATQVSEAIKKYGFITDRVQKSDEGETLVFAQTEQPKDVMIVRLSEQTLVNVVNLKTPGGWVGEAITEYGFFPDLKTAAGLLYEQLEQVTKSETPQDDASAVLTSFAEYLNQLVVIPANAFKLDEAIQEIVEKCACQEKDEEKKEPVTKESEEDEEARKKRIKDHPPSEMAPVDEEDDQKPPPDAVEKSDKKPVEKKEEKKPVAKTEKPDTSNAILAALKGIEATVSGLATKLETVVTEQAAQKIVLDGVVQKADTLTTTLKTTVTAVPVQEDRPGPARMRVQKDDDPRTGNFDTAFLRRRR